jgi:2-enoate reductase
VPAPTANPLHLAIVGGGPAGCETAMLAAERGHRITLIERRDRLGGASVPARNPEFKLELNRLPVWYADQLAELAVTVELGREATADYVESLKPDVVVYARGAMPTPLDTAGEKDPRIVQAIDLLETFDGSGQAIAVVGAGFVGCETAVHLARLGNRVRLVTRRSADDLAMDLNYTVRIALRSMLRDSGVEVVERAEVEDVTEAGLGVSIDGVRSVIEAELVVVARGFTQDPALADELRLRGFDVRLIGETVRTGLILNAVHQGYALGSEI